MLEPRSHRKVTPQSVRPSPVQHPAKTRVPIYMEPDCFLPPAPAAASFAPDAFETPRNSSSSSSAPSSSSSSSSSWVQERGYAVGPASPPLALIPLFSALADRQAPPQYSSKSSSKNSSSSSSKSQRQPGTRQVLGGRASQVEGGRWKREEGRGQIALPCLALRLVFTA